MSMHSPWPRGFQRMRSLAGPSSPTGALELRGRGGGRNRPALGCKASGPPAGGGVSGAGPELLFFRAAPRTGTVTRRTDHGRSRAGAGGFAAPGWEVGGGEAAETDPLPGGPLAPGPVRRRAPGARVPLQGAEQEGPLGEEHEAPRARVVKGGGGGEGSPTGGTREALRRVQPGPGAGLGGWVGGGWPDRESPVCGSAGRRRPELLARGVGRRHRSQGRTGNWSQGPSFLRTKTQDTCKCCLLSGTSYLRLCIRLRSNLSQFPSVPGGKCSRQVLGGSVLTRKRSTSRVWEDVILGNSFCLREETVTTQRRDLCKP